MKSLRYIIIFILATLTLSCKKDSLDKNNIQQVNVSLNLRVENLDLVNTKGITVTEVIEDINILVFDENGLFISRQVATYSSGKYNVVLASSSKKRSIHFVANYDWSNFSDMQNSQVHENEIIMKLETEQKPIYWKRYEFTDGISIETSKLDVVLLRNYAKFELKNNTSGSTRIENIAFCLINVPKFGTVAPFDPNSATFKEGFITQHPKNEFTNTDWTYLGSLYSYEQNNQNSDNCFIILDCDYIINGNKHPEKQYYKLKIVDLFKRPIDIRRNYHYIIKLESVTSLGYGSFEEAVAGEPSNDVTAYVDLKDFNSISNGLHQLSVEKTQITLTKPNEVIKIGYQHISDLINNIVDNSVINVIIENSGNGALNLSTVNVDKSANGSIRVSSSSKMPDAGVSHQSKITISCGELSRDIIITLQNPKPIESISATPTKVGSGAGNSVKVNFTLPQAENVTFPTPIYISTPMNPAIGSTNPKLTLTTINGEMKWVYMATGFGDHSIEFVTTKENNSHIITFQSDYYSDGSLNISSDGTNKFVGVSLYGYGRDQFRLYFTMPIPQNNVNVTIYTKSLVPNPAKKYEYTTVYNPTGYTFVRNWGVIEIDWIRNNNADKTILLTADGYQDYEIAVPK